MQVKDKSSAVLVSEILRLILPGTRVISDALRSYRPLSQMWYQHDFVVHKENFVHPDDRAVHTQNIEIRNRWQKDAPFGATEVTDDCIHIVLRTRTGR